MSEVIQIEVPDGIDIEDLIYRVNQMTLQRFGFEGVSNE